MNRDKTMQKKRQKSKGALKMTGKEIKTQSKDHV